MKEESMLMKFGFIIENGWKTKVMKVKIFLYLYSCCITYLYKPGMSNIRPWARCGSWSSLSVPRALLKPPPVGLNWWSVLGCHSKKAICMIIGFHNILKMWSKIVCSSLLSFATDVFLRNTLLWHIRGWALLAMPLQPTQIIKNICCVIFAERFFCITFMLPETNSHILILLSTLSSHNTIATSQAHTTQIWRTHSGTPRPSSWTGWENESRSRMTDSFSARRWWRKGNRN